MGKVHELLAVEADLKGKNDSFLAEGRNTFSKKGGHFTGQKRVYHPATEEGQTHPDEYTPLNETVPSKLAFTLKHVGRYVDVQFQKENANTDAKADIKVEGKVLAKDVPVGALLALEHRIKEIRELLKTVPTLDPSEEWSLDPEKGEHIYAALPRQTHRTEKILEPFIAHKATKEHPAQVQIINKDVVVGTWETYKWSGMITPAEKSEYLERLDQLSNAVKRARVRANSAEVKKGKISKTLINYVLNGTLPSN